MEMQRASVALWNLVVILLSIVIGYELRNHILAGCAAGLVVCFLGLSIIGLIGRHRRRKNAPVEEPSPIRVREGYSFTVPVGSAGMNFLLHVAAASVAPIIENFQTIAGHTPPGGNVFAQESYDDLSGKYGWHKQPPLDRPEDG